MIKHTIYGLYDPTDRTKEVRYVGATKFLPEHRLTDPRPTTPRTAT